MMLQHITLRLIDGRKERERLQIVCPTPTNGQSAKQREGGAKIEKEFVWLESHEDER